MLEAHSPREMTKATKSSYIEQLILIDQEYSIITKWIH